MRRPARAQAGFTVRAVETEEDWRRIEQLRDVIYVQREGRIAGVDGFSGSFDRFNAQARWFIAVADDAPLGTVKVMADSPAGLPFEEVAGRFPRRPGDVVVELGHLLALPGDAAGAVVRALLRAAFAHGIDELGATHVAGDVFLDRTQGDAFYRRIGFTRLHGPYRDARFLDAPESMVVMLRVDDVPGIVSGARGVRQALVAYLCGECRRPDISAAVKATLA